MKRQEHATTAHFRRSIGRRVLALAWFVGVLVLLATLGAARSLDPQDCPSEKRRVEYADLVFCWPTEDTAPDFKFESPGILLGSQYWIEGRPASVREVEASGNKQEVKHGRSSLALFRIVPADHVLLRIDGRLAVASHIKKTLEARGGKAETTIDVFIGDKFGTREFLFREVQPEVFGAVVAVKDGAVTRKFEFWAPLNSDGAVDYVMSCNVLEQTRGCSSQFVLANEVTSIFVDGVDSADHARHIFEAMREQIRSYVLYPGQDSR